MQFLVRLSNRQKYDRIFVLFLLTMLYNVDKHLQCFTPSAFFVSKNVPEYLIHSVPGFLEIKCFNPARKLRMQVIYKFFWFCMKHK